MEHSITTIKDDHMGSGEYYLNSLRNAEPQSINIVLIDTKMLDTTSKWQTPEQKEDFPTEEKILEKWMTIKEWAMDNRLDPRIMETNSQMAPNRETGMLSSRPIKHSKWKHS